jgi:alkanesulfonate monooxygenase SsuD/methylene tetrahydromethanopterin reductase-like flavin-dependent oxidoreductase (luciferase family)
MRIGVVVLPELPWNTQVRQWQRLEEWGFHAAYTYDHLAWGSLADSPWYATVPVLAAAATATRRIRLGTWVASPNFRHPVPFGKELMTLDELSQGRFVLGVGAGGTGFDAPVLGDAELTAGQRVARFAEFVELLDLLLTQPKTTYDGQWFRAVEARMVPGSVQQPRLPFVVAANGPRAMRVVAQHGQGWATTGVAAFEGDEDRWWAALPDLVSRLDDTLVAAGREPRDVERYLNVDISGSFALESVEQLRDVIGRAERLGFAEIVVHWPRPDGVYAGDERVLEQVATEVLPQLEATAR